MLDLRQCEEILLGLFPAFPLPGWDISIQIKLLKDESGETLSGRTLYDDALRKAIIVIDPRYPKEDEYFTLTQLIAHELGHIVMREVTDDEYCATMFGELMTALSDHFN